MLKKKTKRKKKSCRTSLSGDGTPHSIASPSALDDIDSDMPVAPKSNPDSDTDADLAMDQSSQQGSESVISHHGLTQTRPASVGGDSEVSTAVGTNRGVATAHHSRTSSATADLESQSSAADIGSDTPRQEDVRAALEAAVTQANSAIEVGIAAGDDVLQMVVDELDAAIQQASEASISVKYSKKVRKRLQLLLHEAVAAAAGCDEEGVSAATEANEAPAPQQEWQTAGSKLHKATSSKAEWPAVATASSAGSQSPQRQQQHRHSQVHAQGQAQGRSGNALFSPGSHFAGLSGPPPPPPPRQPPSSTPVQLSSHSMSHPGKAELATVEPPGVTGHTRSKSGNAWGVPAKQRSSTQVGLPHFRLPSTIWHFHLLQVAWCLVKQSFSRYTQEVPAYIYILQLWLFLLC